MMNRALLVQSYEPRLQIQGDSGCEDVRHMKMAISSLIQRKEIPCGEAGTVFRFMGLRAAREKGDFKLLGSPRLMQRPQEEMIYLLSQLSVSSQLSPTGLGLHSMGWKKPLIPIRVHRETSSQFATSLLLNSWDLPFDLEFEMHAGVSEGYWQMSVQMARDLGMRIDHKGDFWKIPAHQKVQKLEISMEPDYSSAFAVAAAGALAGEAVITNATETSTQPDFKFISMMKAMGVEVVHENSVLTVRKVEQMRALDVSLNSSPDLFPVLAVLCAFAKEESSLRGAPHLIHKESNRIEKTAELLRLAGFFVSIKGDGMHILGRGKDFTPTKFAFDPDQDHRMAMAAGLLKLKGFDVQIKNPQVVSKSYPEFWKVLGVRP